MSENNKNSNSPAENSYKFEVKDSMLYVESWFDNHPEPYNIDCHEFNFGNHKVHIYFADMVYETWLIKITCENAHRATILSQMFYKTTCQMNIQQILKNKTLFLFTDKRF